MYILQFYLSSQDRKLFVRPSVHMYIPIASLAGGRACLKNLQDGGRNILYAGCICGKIDT